MRQLVELNKNIERFQAMNASIVAVTADSVQKTRMLSNKIGATFPLVSDPGNAIAGRHAADIEGAALYFVRPDGTIQYGYTDPPNHLDRPPLHMVLALAAEAADPSATHRTSEFDAPCRPNRGRWICPE